MKNNQQIPLMTVKHQWYNTPQTQEHYKVCIDEYQKKAYEFASYGGNLNYPLLGLSEETGEVCGKVAKFIRKHGGREPVNAMKSDEEDYRELVVDLKKELGDVLWMVSAIATDFGLSMEDIASGNISKLEDRLARGVIIGEGDNR